MLHYWPQIIILVSLGVHLGQVLIHYGEPRKEPYNGSDLAGIAISAFLLYMGGFFS